MSAEYYVVDELAFRVAVILPLQEYEQRKDRPCCGGRAARRAGYRVQEAVRAVMAGYAIRVKASREISRHCRAMFFHAFSRV